MKHLGLITDKLRVFLATEIRRDTQSLVGFCAAYLWIFFLCFTYEFFFKSALWQKNIRFDGHEMDFPLFLVSGLVVVRIIPFSIRIFDDILSCLKNSSLTEWVLTTPTSLWELFAAKAVWNGARVLAEVVVLIGVAKFFIGTPFKPFLQSGLIGPIFLMFVAYAGIGMMISSASLYLKKGNVLFPFFIQVSTAFGGVFFPTQLFTGKLKLLSVVSDSLPITHTLNVVRFALIHEKTPNAMAHGQILASMALIFSLTGFILLQRGLVWARKNGEFSKELYN